MTNNTITTADLLTAIYDTWADIRITNPDLPRVTITLASGKDKRGMKYGHFHANMWKDSGETSHELFIGGEGLTRGPEGLLATILHEAAHALAHARGVKDTSRQGRYHNDKFRVIAQQLGLTVTKDPKIGWSPSELAEGTKGAYTTSLATLGSAMTMFRLREADDDSRKSKPGFTAEHACLATKDTYVIRMSRKAFEAIGGMTCNACMVAGIGVAASQFVGNTHEDETDDEDGE